MAERPVRQPVSVTAGTTYVASYFAPNGHYSVTGSAFNSSVTNGPLTAPSNASSGGNGVYMYSGQNDFPNNSFNAANYWVDVTVPPTSTPGARPGDGHGRPGLGHGLVDGTDGRWRPDDLHRHAVHRLGRADADDGHGTPPATTTTVKGLTPGTSYTFTVKGANVNGNGPESAHSNAVTPQGRPPRRRRRTCRSCRPAPRLRSTGARRTTTAAARSPATR